VPSSSLIPADSSVLFTTAGMQQFVPYLTGEKDVLRDFGSRHLASTQKCFRTLDIEEVGDDTHHTFFEMLGNWSIGQDEKGYFKRGAIELALDFFVNELSLPKERFWITIFKGEKGVPRDEESLRIWQEMGIPKERIVEFGLEDNFWGPTAKTGPCGPCSEIHFDRGPEYGCEQEDCGPNCERCKRFVELWNLVFMEYNKTEKGDYQKLPQKNVDTGIGFERLISVLENKPSAYETDLFSFLIRKIEELCSKDYFEEKKSFRVIADHIRGAVFLASEGVTPSNVERGYVLRRILRRAMRYGRILKLERKFLIPLAKEVINFYQDFYPETKEKQEALLEIIRKEEEKFEKTLGLGLKHFEKIAKKGSISGQEAFHLFDTYGFPFEFVEEMAREKGIKLDKKGFQEAFERHRKVSRAGAEKKFGGVGKGAGYQSAKLHTATHLLHAALRQVLGEHIRQMGSDINPQRLRFDFSHSQKMTPQEIKEVEDLVNRKIKEGLKVEKKEMPYQEAVKEGALAFFKEKYPEIVSVYSINNFSKEICAGPHVERTSELGRFKIVKEESSGAGVRRIRAVLVP